jgi:large subunit ribosomal protein L25
MATSHVIPAQGRSDEGKGASRRLRRSGQLPAVVYGGHQEPQSIQLLHNTVFLASQHEWFYSAILDLDLEGTMQKVLVRDMQRHPFKPLILHVDFQRVSENEALRVSVPLHFIDQARSPAGKTSGVVISHNLTEVEISCLPRDLPEFIALDLSELNVGDIVHLSELKLPEGVEIPELKLGKEHDIAVVTASFVQEEVEPAAEGEAPAEVPASKQSIDEKK